MNNDEVPPDREITPTEVQKRIKDMIEAIGSQQLDELFGLMPSESEEAKKRVGTRTGFMRAVKHVLFDMIMNDPNIGPNTRNRGYLLEELGNGLEKYITDEAYREKYAYLKR